MFLKLCLATLQVHIYFFQILLHFCPDLLVMLKIGLFRKLKSISKFMTSQAGQQIITIDILSNILRSKGNQKMKSGQLIEYNIKNTFLGKSYTKCDGEASSSSSTQSLS